MTSLKVKTTLTQLFLLPASARLPEWEQGSFLQGEGMAVYCNSVYIPKFCCWIISYPVLVITPPMLLVD